MEKNILIVPGFVVDTFTQIEKSYIELSREKTDGIRFIWLVPSMENKYNRYKHAADKDKLDMPLYVRFLQAYGIQYIVGNIAKYNIFANCILFYRIFKKYRINAVFTHFGFERFYTAFIGKLFGKIVIWTEHWYSLGTRNVLFKKVFFRLFIDYFICASSFIASTLPNGSRVLTVKHAMDIPQDNTVPDRDKIRKKIKLDDGLKVILMVADFMPEKRHDLALKICRSVLRCRRDVLFIFLGDGEGRENFVNDVNRLKLQKYILLPGHVHNVDEYYQAADISMLTSIHEAFGFVVLEAFKNALPVVAFRSGGPGEIIQDRYTGILVAEGDTDRFAAVLLELLDRPDYCRNLGQNAYEMVKREYNPVQWKRVMLDNLKNICLPGRTLSDGSDRR